MKIIMLIMPAAFAWAQATPPATTATNTAGPATKQQTTLRGVLLDAPCTAALGASLGTSASGLIDARANQSKAPGATGTADAAGTTGGTADRSNAAGGASSVKPGSAADSSTSRVRSTADDLIPCQASLTTTAFAFRTKDGRVLRFDHESNGKLLVKIESGEEWKQMLGQVSGSPESAAVSKANAVPGDTKTPAAASAPRNPREIEVAGTIDGDTLHVDNVRRF